MSDRDADLIAIRQLAEAWRAGWIAGDAEALLDLYADEPVLLPQGQPAVVGRSAIRPLYEAALKEYDISGESVLNEVEVDGDLGYIRSSYTLTATAKGGGKPTTVAGKSIFIVKRQGDGRWKIARLIDNSDTA